MRSTEELLEELGARNVKLWLDGESVRFSAPKAVLTAALRAELAEHKPGIVAILKRASEGHENAQPGLGRVPRTGRIPLSCGQERLWSLAKLHPESCVYNISSAFRLQGPLDTVALEEGLQEIQRRHEILRTGFPIQDGRPQQEISPDVSITLPLTDLSPTASGERERLLQEALVRDIERPFDLSLAPLWRCRLLRLGPDEHVLSMVMHHIIFDGGSKEVLLAELESLYRARSSGGPAASLPDLPLQFADFAVHQSAWLESEDAERQRGYWSDRLAGSVGELQLPTDHPRPAAPPFRGGSEPFVLPEALAERVAALCREEQVSLYIALLAAFEALIQRHTGQLDLLLCSPAACRDDRRLEDLIGYFNNVVALRTDLAGNPTFRVLLGRVREAVLGASTHQNLPFQNVSGLPNLARTALTRGMFSFRNLTGREFGLHGLSVSSIDVRKQQADFDLAMYMEERDGRLSGILEYNADLFDPATIGRLLQSFEIVIEALVNDPDGRLDKLPRFGVQPSDVEALLCGHPKIDEAVIVERTDRPGPYPAVAYLVLNEHDVPTLAEIREVLRAGLPDYRVPRALVPLDQIPLRSEGVVDVAALPPPPLADAGSSPTHVAPRNRLEKQLAEIWARVLWLDGDIGIHDSFIDLGGHSLLSVQLVDEVEKLLGRRLPARALGQMGTIAGFVAALEPEPEAEASSPPSGGLPADILHGIRAHVASWEGKRVGPDSLIVGLNTEGSKQALFWCLQRYGELTQLAKYLGSAQPVYGMRSGARVMEQTPENIDALAEHHLQEVLAIQPEGPYLVGGNCQAARIAFQVATGLRARGHEITLLFMLEKFVAEPYSGRIAVYFGADSNRNPKLYYREPERGWRRYYSGPLSTGEVPGAHRQFFREPNVQGLAETVRTAIEEAQSARAGDREGTTARLLPDSAYRARFTAPRVVVADPGEEVTVCIEVTNTSDTVWPAFDSSGIALGNRWLARPRRMRRRRRAAPLPLRGGLEREDRGVTAVEARAPLPLDLEPGSTVHLELRVTAPSEPGTAILEIDLVEEGVTWFRQMGSKPVRLKARARGRSGLFGRLRNAWS